MLHYFCSSKGTGKELSVCVFYLSMGANTSKQLILISASSIRLSLTATLPLNIAHHYTMDATDVEHGSATELVGIPEANENSDAGAGAFTESTFADDNTTATVTTAESDETETMISALASARKSITRMKSKPNLRTSLPRRLSMEQLPSLQRPLLQRRLSMQKLLRSSSAVPGDDECGEDDLLLDEDSEKKSEVQGADNWWKFVFVFSFISMTACVLTLWLKYPYGARMSTEEVAAMPWSNGCINLDSCICPRVSLTWE